MWRRRWSLGKCLYLFIRYLGLLTVIFDISVMFGASITSNFCTAFIWWEIISAFSAVLSAQVVLLCRVYAVYGGNKKLLGVLAVMLALGTFATLLVLGLGKPEGIGLTSPFTGCFASPTAKSIWFWMLPSLIHETVFCSLMIFKAIQILQDGYGSPLLSAMIHDSCIYFLGIFTTLLVNCILCYPKNEVWSGMASLWTSTISCTTGSRLLVNIIEWGEFSKAYHDPLLTTISFDRVDGLQAYQGQSTTVIPATDEFHGVQMAVRQ